MAFVCLLTRVFAVFWLVFPFFVIWTMEDEMANLHLADGEEDAFWEDDSVVNKEYQYYLVDRCLTDSVVHFSSLRNNIL